MKKYIYGIALLSLYSFALTACSSKSDEPDPTPVQDGVEVKIATTSIQTKAAKLEFTSNDKMNVFAKTYNRIDAPNIVDNVVATYNGSTWDMQPKVTINQSQKNAFVYAVAPFDASYTDAQRIPVDINKQIDLMYSGSYVPASLNSPQVKLTMKHALSLLSFNIIPVNYSGAGNLTKITLNGEILYTKGVMDASTGTITGTTGNNTDVTATFNKKLSADGSKNDIPGIWSLPFNTKAGDVKLNAVIDGRNFEVILPEVEVGTGWQYIFRLALTDRGLEFDPSKTETISLNVTEDNPQEFVGYGLIVLTANGQSLVTPLLSGDAVFGTLSLPGSASSYTTSVNAEGLSNGQEVSLESWNSTGFSISSLEGISTIDISAYE